MFKRLVLVILALALVPVAHAQPWPARPLKFVMSAPAGSSIDVLGRTIV